MFRKSALPAFVIAAALLFIACPKEPTVGHDTIPKGKLTGTLVLGAGQTGDIQGCMVQLLDLQGSLARQVLSGVSSDTTTSPFTFPDVTPGYYYLIAWKDVNDDGIVNIGELVGVYNGTYDPNLPGKGSAQVDVVAGQTTNAGDIMMAVSTQ